MQFQENTLYHIFNQGNNKQKLFFSEKNYEHFLWKMRGNLLPFGDIVSWCLMPNHYHWCMLVKNPRIERKTYKSHTHEIEMFRRKSIHGSRAIVSKASKSEVQNSFTTLNSAIGNIQRSYARAINKQENRTGSLFRQKFKAKNGWEDGMNQITSLDP